MKRATIKVRSVGQNFGVQGEVYNSNGCFIARTRLFPHDCNGAAAMSAEVLAASLGYTVVKAVRQ